MPESHTLANGFKSSPGCAISRSRPLTKTDQMDLRLRALDHRHSGCTVLRHIRSSPPPPKLLLLSSAPACECGARRETKNQAMRPEAAAAPSLRSPVPKRACTETPGAPERMSLLPAGTRPTSCLIQPVATEALDSTVISPFLTVTTCSPAKKCGCLCTNRQYRPF